MADKQESFGILFRKFRLKSGFRTLSEFGDALAQEGLVYEDSLFSRWQKGDRVPSDRKILLTIIKLFVKHSVIQELNEANTFMESAGCGYLTESEKLILFNVNVRTNPIVVTDMKIDKDALILPIRDFLDYNKKLVDEAENMLLEGKCNELKKFSSIIYENLNNITKLPTVPQRKEFANQLIKILFLKGRALGSVELPQNILPKMLKIADRINLIIKTYAIDTIYHFYADDLLANAYYVAGNYSISQNVSSYNKSMSYAKHALENMNDDHYERLFILRTLTVSSIYIKDKQTFLELKNFCNNNLNRLPLNYYSNGLHLFNTLAKGEAYFKLGDPMKTKEKAEKYFGRSLKNTHLYEVSDIRNELEIFKLLKIKDRTYVKNQVNRAIEICRNENYLRHWKSIKKLAAEVSY